MDTAQLEDKLAITLKLVATWLLLDVEFTRAEILQRYCENVAIAKMLPFCMLNL
jgi:hypothetical protein